MQMRQRQGEAKGRGKETEVLVMNFGKTGLLKERMALTKKLRDAGIKVSVHRTQN
jgi:histidyl-tRNA synthetase